LEHKFNEKEKECNIYKEELSKLKDKNTNDYMKSSNNFEQEKKSLMDKLNEYKQQLELEKNQ